MLFENMKKKKITEKVVEILEDTLNNIDECTYDEKVDRLINLLKQALNEIKKVTK